jgi:hypothetical protein
LPTNEPGSGQFAVRCDLIEFPSAETSNAVDVSEVEVLMPDSWDPKRYRERAKDWRDKAASLPEGRARDSCVTIAEGYEGLAEIIEAQRAEGRPDSGRVRP